MRVFHPHFFKPLGTMNHQTRLCQNPECALRFTSSAAESQNTHCPRCGSSSKLVIAGYESAQVPERKLEDEKLPQIIAVLDNIRSALNVGAILRTADGAGVQKVVLCGITPTPLQPKVAKTALGAEDSVAWEHSWDILQLVERLKAEGTQIWCLEGGENAVNLFQNIGKIPTDRPLALIVGNEVNGVDPAILKIADCSVYLPMQGEKESLNVATAFGIAVYLLRYGITIK